MKRYLPDEIVKGGMTSDVLEILNLEAEEVPLHEVIFRLVEEVLDEKKQPSEASVKKAEKGLEKSAKEKGFEEGSEEWNRYVYGGKRKMGWKPERELSEEEELDEVTTMGGSGGGHGAVEISGGKGGGPFKGFSVEKENEDERKRSKTNENKDLVEETLNYLLNVINQ